MPQFLIQGSYTSDAWAAQVKNPQNRIDVVRPAFEALGGSLDHAWLTFGEYDIIGIATFPNNVSAAAVSIAVAAGGSIKLKTTPLLSMEETLEATKKADQVTYTPPDS